MKKIFVLIFGLSICGCSSNLNFTLIPEEAGFSGNGIATRGNNAVSISFKDKTYIGKYVYVEGVNKYGSQQESSTITSYILEVANGKLHVMSKDGDSIRCEFLYSKRFGRGVCFNSNGLKYDLLIDG
jgi:hypothetical protein